jgi:transposase
MPGDGPDGRVTVKRTFKTFYRVMGEVARRLVSLGVTHVAMEATGVYSMPVYYALLEHGDFEKVLICNAAHVKNDRLVVNISAPALGQDTSLSPSVFSAC